MNLYNFHSKPESLDYYGAMNETNPHIFWKKYRNNKEELKKREKYIAKVAEHAYLYARDVLHGPFPAGEAVIAKDVYFAHQYAKYALKKDFYLDGKLIAKFEK